MTNIFVFDQAEHPGGSIARAVDLAISMPEYNFIIGTYHPLDQLYHRPPTENIKTLRFYSFYNYQKKFQHTLVLRRKTKNRFLYLIGRKLIALLDWTNEISLTAQAAIRLFNIPVEIVQANSGIHFLPYRISLQKKSALIYYFRHLDDYRWASGAMIERAHMYLFVGKNLMANHRSLITLPERRCKVVYSPFNTVQRLVESTPGDMAFIKTLKSSNRFIILMAARICHAKGQDIAIDAIMKLTPKYPHIILLLAGDEDKPYADNLRSKIHRLQLQDNIVFIGQRRDIPHLLANSDLALQAPRWYEALSGSLVEAMQLGVLTISANIGGAPEVIEQGKTGFLFQPGNSDELAKIIENILENRLDIDSLRNAAAEHTNRVWNQEKIHREMLSIYKETIKSRNIFH